MQPTMIIPFVLALAAGQTAADVRQMYDAGRYQDVVRTAEQGSDRALRLQYVTAQSYSKLNDTDGARRTYQRLAESGDRQWAAVGKSALQLMDKRLDEALAAANQAAGTGDLPEAHFQRGLVMMARSEYGEAASAFTKATQLDSGYAAAYYYAGLANYRAERVNLMAGNFETFVKLAPNAPERPEVESILRTLRGR